MRRACRLILIAALFGVFCSPATAARNQLKVPAKSAEGLDGLDLWNVADEKTLDYTENRRTARELRRLATRAQYAVTIIDAVNIDRDDGGVGNVYLAYSGTFADEAVGLMKRVGAKRHARVLADANRIIAPHGRVPESRLARDKRMDRIDPAAFDGVEARWSKLGPLEDVVARYIRAHPFAFFI